MDAQKLPLPPHLNFLHPKPNIPILPLTYNLPNGFIKHVRVRRARSQSGRPYVVIVPPEGPQLRSHKDLLRFISANPDKEMRNDVNLVNFELPMTEDGKTATTAKVLELQARLTQIRGQNRLIRH